MPLSAKSWSKLEQEAERVAVEIANHYGKCLPLDQHFQTTVTAYYANGRIYEVNHSSTPVTRLPALLQNAERYGWTISYNPDEKSFTFEKHFPSGMYRIATYVPYNKDAISIDAVDDGAEHVTGRIVVDE